MDIDWSDPKWRFEERVNALVQRHEKSRGITREVAEDIVRTVIETKENPQC
jgi:hypothetical protein